ncbi:methyltransferase domain-containing protein [Streptomyces syringium]|uniref:methyltransferase domain-containing protein n=1 Tax=Streptomyces syringium TaxID=76729 RepID=UPI0036CB83C1
MTTEAPSADDLRRLMTERLVTAGFLRSPAWIEAFSTVPRHLFVPRFTVRAKGTKHEYQQGDPSWLTAAYSDTSLLTQFDASGTATSSSTELALMATMLEALDAEGGHRILDDGLGTGYQAALLSHRVGSRNVFSMDIDPALVAAAKEALQEAGFTPNVTAGDGMAGWPEHGPFDRLLASFGVDRIPAAWLLQVRPGGIIVANIGCGIIRMTVGDDGRATGKFLPTLANFMVARPTADTVKATAKEYVGPVMAAQGQVMKVNLPNGLNTAGPRFLASLAQPSVVDFTLTDGEGEQVHCLYDEATGSWARLTFLDVRVAQLEFDGPRDLWGEREPLLTHWALNGRPAPERYGLTVDTEGLHTLWLDSPSDSSFPLDT